MKGLFPILFFFYVTSFLSCESTGDCLTSTGSITEVFLEVDGFTKVEINDYFLVTIKQAPIQSITLISGKNIIKEIDYGVTDGIFSINNTNSCNWVRESNPPKLIITSPNLVEIRQNGGGIIHSEGSLSYPDLHLISEKVSGDFELIVNNQKLRITSNSLNNYRISGSVDDLRVGFFSGDGRFEGEQLIAKRVNFFHRGTNEMIVYATESLTGSILATGNLIYVKAIPPIKDISIENRGRVIFRP